MPTVPIASSSSASSSASQSKSSKRKWSRERLLRSLEVLSTVTNPLPAELPPSPPASRNNSPNPGSKRKLESQTDSEPIKRSRTVLQPSFYQHSTAHSPLPPSQNHLRPPPNSSYSIRSESTEDGEVREESSTSAIPSVSRGPATVVSNPVPVRRPRRGRPPLYLFDEMHDKYHQWGRMLKYSGDARFWSAYPSTHKEYKPLLDPPPLNSPYHKFSNLISRLELVDALVCFTYSIWCKDYSRRCCLRTWATIEAFLSWCKQKWQSEDTVGERERAFVGLIWMIEAFIHGRKFSYSTRNRLEPDMKKLLAHCSNLVDAAMAAAEQPPTGKPGLGPDSTPPPMLPSPASIAPSKSANSTPTGRPEGTPSSNSSHFGSGNGPPGDKPSPSPAALEAAARVTVSIGPQLVTELREQSGGITAASWSMDRSQRTLNLPIMARYFPTTFARMIHSSLLAHEEHEPDIEDEEGELFWPGQCVTGEGLGWVCLMGKAMVKELGKEIGYRGLDGIVPKPKLDEHAEETSQGPDIPATQR